MADSLQIGELARQSGCKIATIRYYERQGLLPAPVRTAGNYRVYSPAHTARLTFIRNCRGLDMTLDEIRALLNIRDLAKEDCSAAHELLDEHIHHVADRIHELEELQTQLRSLRRSCSSNKMKHTHCAILDDLDRSRMVVRTPTPHVKGSHR